MHEDPRVLFNVVIQQPQFYLDFLDPSWTWAIFLVVSYISLLSFPMVLTFPYYSFFERMRYTPFLCNCNSCQAFSGTHNSCCRLDWRTISGKSTSDTLRFIFKRLPTGSFGLQISYYHLWKGVLKCHWSSMLFRPFPVLVSMLVLQ